MQYVSKKEKKQSYIKKFSLIIVKILLYLFLVANILWNNLFQPIGNKTTTWIPVFETFLCPTSERPYLLTRENSQIEQQRLKIKIVYKY